ncbi:MAG: DDE-type integrase/transposase/recombinase [Pseudomonadales bacterium]|nr:DDE-type integrase/transposase/recombinase [Pseudomonadales bacterium]
MGPLVLPRKDGHAEPGLIHHSDRGGQYTSDDFRNELVKHGIKCSMSSTGNCYDNAVVESFFAVLEANVLTAFAIGLARKYRVICSDISRCFTTVNGATNTVAI